MSFKMKQDISDVLNKVILLASEREGRVAETQNCLQQQRYIGAQIIHMIRLIPITNVFIKVDGFVYSNYNYLQKVNVQRIKARQYYALQFVRDSSGRVVSLIFNKEEEMFD